MNDRITLLYKEPRTMNKADEPYTEVTIPCSLSPYYKDDSSLFRIVLSNYALPKPLNKRDKVKMDGKQYAINSIAQGFARTVVTIKNDG